MSTSGTGGANIFGTAGASGSNTPSLFGGGSTQSGASNIFGSKPPTGTSSSLFGNATATSGGEQKSSPFGSGAGTPSLFGGGSAGGAATSGSTASPSLFGNPSGAAANTFGQQPASSSAGGFKFGTQPTAGGNASTTPQGPANTAGSLFGKPAGSTSGASLFGSTTPTTGATQQIKPAGSLFGAPASSNATGPGLFANFGSKDSSQNASGTSTPQANKPQFSFSTTPAGNPPPNASLFGQPKQNEGQAQAPSSTAEQPKSAFTLPSAGASGATSGTLFGEVKKDDQAKPSAFPSFGTTPAASTSQSAAAQTSAAGATTQSQPAAAANVFSLGGNNSGASSTGATNLFAQKAAGQTAATPTSTGGASAPSLFAKPSTQSNPSVSQPGATPAPASSGTASSLFGAQAAPNAGSTSQAAAPSTTPAASLFGAPQPAAQPATTGAAPAPSLFGAANPSQPATTTAAASTAASAGTTTATAGSTLFGSTTGGAAASTSGPAPPPQSRLAQKSMDEIITMWSTSLASHQKTFKTLASQISTWDQMLVENGSKISSLYCRCFQAERDCSEVERQLSVVEHGQSELEALLDRYENDIDKMIEQTGAGEEGAGGVDGERERTYKTAEACSLRLTDMSHSLTDMIDEINAATSKLSSNATRGSSAADDPLSQIVRVLNSHLSQLQTIDAGASDLKEKVEAAQKDQGILAQSQGVNGGGWMEDFGRSYLGRR